MTEPQEKRPTRRRFWPVCRIYFRRFRITLWLLALLLLGCSIYLNQVGLPGFIKRPLLQTLREHGLDLQFSRLRMRWYEGIVAENVRFGRADDPLTPELTLKEVQVLLNFRALLHLQLQIEKLVLRHGSFTWPFAATNGIAQALTIDNIQSDLRFLPDDLWSLDNFKAQFAGADIRLSGMVTNASAAGQWSFFHGQRTEPATAQRWQHRLQRLSDSLNRINFSAPPELRLDVRGDANDLQTFSVVMILAAPGAETPWGNFSAGRFTARVFPATNGASRAELALEATTAQTRWASAQALQLEIKLLANEQETNLVHGELHLSAQSAITPWATGSNLTASASWIHALTNPIPLSGRGKIQGDSISSDFGTARSLLFESELSTPAAAELPTRDSSWGLWTNIQPFALQWDADVQEFESPRIKVTRLLCGGAWKAPSLTVTNFDAHLYDGSFNATADLDVITRFTNVRLQSDFDPQRLKPLLNESARRWLEQYSWNGVPKVAGNLQVVLPAWTNSQPDWPAEVKPTLQLSGRFDIPGGSHKGIEVSSAQSHFAYSNSCWHLPDLKLVRPEGMILAEHWANQQTKDFYWRIHSDIDPGIARPLLQTNAQTAFDLLVFTNPPVVDAQIWGTSRDPDRVGLKGHIALTNFSFRGQGVTSLQADISFTNRVLEILRPRAQRGSQVASADGLLADFDRSLLFLTNGFSTMPPAVVTAAIGQKILKIISPYRFQNPPIAHVHGTIPLRAEDDADLYFEVEGGPFAWWKFHVPHISASLHWKGLALSLRDVQMDFYSGQAGGSADFAFPRGQPGTDFSFHLNTTNVLLQALMADLSERTNRLEGFLGGSVTITRANSESWNSVFGHGNLALRDGLIWEIPLFGIFTPVLNGISPGLGSSRAGALASVFTITNGVVHSDNLEIHSPAMRLQYRGTVDFDSRVNARVEAELLRDVWLVGPVVSTVFWPVTKMFEYKLTGTLSEPKTESVFLVPKLVLLPFHPFRSLRSLLPIDPSSKTNSAPVFLDLPPAPVPETTPKDNPSQ